MPKPPVPDDLQDFLRRPNPAVVASISLGDELHSAATWYAWLDDGTLLLNMDSSRRRLAHLRRDPRVSLTVLDSDNWYQHVSLSGHVRELRPDPELRDIDGLSQRYTGKPYADRRRDSWTAIIEVDRWHGWINGRDITKR